jgi:hypothetical protein
MDIRRSGVVELRHHVSSRVGFDRYHSQPHSECGVMENAPTPEQWVRIISTMVGHPSITTANTPGAARLTVCPSSWHNADTIAPGRYLTLADYLRSAFN